VNFRSLTECMCICWCVTEIKYKMHGRTIKIVKNWVQDLIGSCNLHRVINQNFASIPQCVRHNMYPKIFRCNFRFIVHLIHTFLTSYCLHIALYYTDQQIHDIYMYIYIYIYTHTYTHNILYIVRNPTYFDATAQSWGSLVVLVC